MLAITRSCSSRWRTRASRNRVDPTARRAASACPEPAARPSRCTQIARPGTNTIIDSIMRSARNGTLIEQELRQRDVRRRQHRLDFVGHAAQRIVEQRHVPSSFQRCSAGAMIFSPRKGTAATAARACDGRRRRPAYITARHHAAMRGRIRSSPGGARTTTWCQQHVRHHEKQWSLEEQASPAREGAIGKSPHRVGLRSSMPASGGRTPGAAKQIESMRSSMPPWPSMTVPKSLTPRSRLIGRHHQAAEEAHQRDHRAHARPPAAA